MRLIRSIWWDDIKSVSRFCACASQINLVVMTLLFCSVPPSLTDYIHWIPHLSLVRRMRPDWDDSNISHRPSASWLTYSTVRTMFTPFLITWIQKLQKRNNSLPSTPRILIVHLKKQLYLWNKMKRQKTLLKIFPTLCITVLFFVSMPSKVATIFLLPWDVFISFWFCAGLFSYAGSPFVGQLGRKWPALPQRLQT